MIGGTFLNKDLTSGSPDKVLFKFCLPLFASVIFQQLYNIADSFVAGKFIGNDALAAVGNGYEITLIYIAVAFGCNIGCSVTSAKLFGAKRYSDLKTSVYSALIASGAVCAVMMIIGTAFSTGLLSLIRTPAELMHDSRLYLNIYTLGLPFVFFYNISTGIFSAFGDSKTPFYFLMCSSVSNILVDILFVAVFDMGVAGVAWATFICQGISAVLAVTVVFKRLSSIKTDSKVKIFSARLLGEFAAVAVPSALQQSFVSVGNIIIQSAINGFGKEAMAGYSAAIKLNNVVITSITTLSNGISSFTAQNMGAKKHERILLGFKSGVKLVLLICLPITILYFAAADKLVYIFLDSPTGAAVDIGVMFLHIVSPFYFLIATKITADGILRGMGLMSRFMAATFIDLVIRVILALVFSKTALGITGIWCAWPIGWVIAAVISLYFYWHDCVGKIKKGLYQ